MFWIFGIVGSFERSRFEYKTTSGSPIRLPSKVQRKNCKFSTAMEKSCSFFQSWFELDLSTSFQLLRCFGQFIKNVKIDCYLNYFSPVLIHINEYCAESLVKISFQYAKEDHLKLLTRQFTKIQDVEIHNCYLTENGWFKKTFPKIEHLNKQYHY